MITGSKSEVVTVIDRPQDIDNEEAMSFFSGQEGDAGRSLRVGAKA